MSDSAATTQALHRTLPQITEINRYFWCAGSDGQLHILRCGSCATWIHPYAARCPKCGSAALSPQPTSGRAAIIGYTVNHQPWIPGLRVPYAVAIVELAEQSNIRLMTNLPRIPLDEVRIGLRVKVYFERHGDIFLPLFEAE